MSLWTPYEPEQVLDLSRTAVTLKQEPLSPRFPYSPPTPPCAASPDSNAARMPRPFKAVTAALPECGAAPVPDPAFAAFRYAMLEAMRARNGGSLTVSNPRMRRSVRGSSDGADDADYLQRRARNNAAAKRSRDLRKQKEDELAIRVAYLEHQNSQLQQQNDQLRAALAEAEHTLPRYSPY